ncbi:MAG: DUF4167 domain-containing protein [Hyphomicrobiaceae bacterium]
MRQGQQHRRGRGRNRKGQSPVARSFESNGPDVKIRGTPAHIAEKYMSLARDAQASGDPVLAENYLQHAEHYNRIIMSYRESQVLQSGDMMNGGGAHRHRPPYGAEAADSGEDYGEDDGVETTVEAAPPLPGSEPQPTLADVPPRPVEPPEPQVVSESAPPPRARPVGGRGLGRERRPPMGNRAPAAGQPPVEDPRQRGERFSAAPHEQPEFLRRPIRRPRRETESTPDTDGDAESTPNRRDKSTA